jgi:Protein of unknown function (DUF2950)
MKDEQMKSKTRNISAWHIVSAILVPTLLSVSAVLLHAAPQQKSAPPEPTQKEYPTPDAAALALIQASENYDVPALLAILGPDSRDLVASNAPVDDKNRSVAFAALARAKHSVTIDSRTNRAQLLVGNEDWPLPIPIVKRNGSWYFDSKAGRTEILFRRIGENELNAILICRGFVEAQHDYASDKHDGAPLTQYAQRIISTPGRQDGLSWQNPDGSWGGPVGEEAAKFIEQGYSRSEPYHGYYFKVLKGQGPAAPMGEMDFVVDGVMIGGFALVAAPAQYRVTGVQTFMVSHDGVVYQKDLGADTLSIFKSLERFNPDKTWHPTNDEP